MGNYYDNQLSHMEHLMFFGESKENKGEKNIVIENKKYGADGNVYGIVREGTKYYVKVTSKDKENILESFDYVGGFNNRKECEYSSYADAVKAQVGIESRRFDIRHQMRIETSGDTGKDRRDRKDNDLVGEEFNAHRFCRDGVIPHSFQVSSQFGIYQPVHQNISQDDEDQRKIEELRLGSETIAKECDVRDTDNSHLPQSYLIPVLQDQVDDLRKRQSYNRHISAGNAAHRQSQKKSG